jgi:hypothetical protein
MYPSAIAQRVVPIPVVIILLLFIEAAFRALACTTLLLDVEFLPSGAGRMLR